MRKTVATLLGKAHVEMALECLGSLRRYSADPIKFRVHDDGSLTGGDLDQLAAGLGEDLEAVPRREADEKVEALLGPRPALREARRRNPLILKLLDAPLLAEGGELAFCDSDVLFLRPFRDLFRVPGPETRAVFMADRQNAYSLRSWHLLRHRLMLPAQVNTGVLLFRTGGLDLDLLEWYLSRPEMGFAPVWVEQTAWALLAGRASCQLYDPGQIAFPGEDGPADPVALHFVSPLRQLLEPALRQARDRQGEPPVAVGTREAGRCGPLDLAFTEVGRRLRRLAGR